MVDSDYQVILCVNTLYQNALKINLGAFFDVLVIIIIQLVYIIYIIGSCVDIKKIELFLALLII